MGNWKCYNWRRVLQQSPWLLAPHNVKRQETSGNIILGYFTQDIQNIGKMYLFFYFTNLNCTKLQKQFHCIIKATFFSPFWVNWSYYITGSKFSNSRQFKIKKRNSVNSEDEALLVHTDIILANRLQSVSAFMFPLKLLGHTGIVQL